LNFGFFVIIQVNSTQNQNRTKSFLWMTLFYFGMTFYLKDLDGYLITIHDKA